MLNLIADPITSGIAKLLILAAPLTPAAEAPLDDLLFSKMAGDWIGTGERVYFNSQRKIALKTHTHSFVDNNTLISENSWFETDTSDGSTRNYNRTYWIRPSEPSTGQYELGSGNPPGKVAAHGTFSDSVFTVTQQIGGAAGYTIQTQSIFEAGVTLYFESAHFGENKVSEAQMRYIPITQP